MQFIYRQIGLKIEQVVSAPWVFFPLLIGMRTASWKMRKRKVAEDAEDKAMAELQPELSQLFSLPDEEPNLRYPRVALSVMWISVSGLFIFLISFLCTWSRKSRGLSWHFTTGINAKNSSF